MADYLGLTFETVSRQFSRLKAEKIIELPKNRQVVIRDLDLLSAVGHVDDGSGKPDSYNYGVLQHL
jgi:CRP/FNR family transcriptional regulator